MEMFMLKTYTIPRFLIGRWMKPDLCCFYVIQRLPVSFVSNEIGTRTVFVTDTILLIEALYKRDRGCKV